MVIWNTVVTVGIDPTTTFKEFFLHTSFCGANWLALFQSVCRGNRHCGDTEYTIHTLLTCKPFALEILEQRISAEARRELTRIGFRGSTTRSVGNCWAALVYHSSVGRSESMVQSDLFLVLLGLVVLSLGGVHAGQAFLRFAGVVAALLCRQGRALAVGFHIRVAGGIHTARPCA